MSRHYSISRKLLLDPTWQIFAVSTVCSCYFIVKILLTIVDGEGLNHIDGAWTTLANDFKAGIFYRPLFSEEIGFGGTRYFPFFFILHALAMGIIDNPINSGHFINCFIGLMLILSVYLYLKQMRLKPYIAYVFSLSILAFETVQEVLQRIQSDILPLTCNIFGIIIFQSKISSKYREYLSALFFVLAFFSKITAVHGIVTLLIWLVGHKRYNEMMRILVYTITGYFFGFVVINYLSSGGFMQIFLNCIFGGGSLHGFFKAPINIVNVLASSPTCLISIFLAGFFIINSKNKLGSLQNILWLVTLIITMIIFGSPGTDQNHLIDISVVSVIVCASFMVKAKYSKIRVFRSILISFLVFSVCYSIYSVRHDINRFKLGDSYETTHKDIIKLIEGNEGIILSENPLLPILAKKRPYLLDAFMLRVVISKNEAVKNTFNESIEKKKYPFIILMFDPEKRTIYQRNNWYDEIDFGSDQINAIMNNYLFYRKIDNFYVYAPI
jgi:hypothetical protein